VNLQELDYKMNNEQQQELFIKSLANIQQELCLRSLFNFVRLFWSSVDGSQFVDEWHLRAICEHLEAVYAGRIKRLIINIPPRCTKTLINSVFFPIWCWLKNPALNILTGSYSKDLALGSAVQSRYLLNCPKFRQLFGDRIPLVDDQNQKSNYRNTSHGVRRTYSVLGTLTGTGGDIIVIDDPLNVVDGWSRSRRDTCNRWYDEALSTRLNDPATGAIVLVMQRLHEDDLSGHLLERGGWEHLCLPMWFDSERRCKTSIDFIDPRAKEGELLTSRFSVEYLEEKKRDLGEWGIAGQMQQRPAPVEGGIIKQEWWQYYDGKSKNFAAPIISIDSAFKTGEENDYTVITVWGMSAGSAYLIDMFRGRVEFPQLKTMTNAHINKYKPRIVLVEDAASGQSLIQEFKQICRYAIKAVKVDRDKVSRVHAVSAMVQAGNVFLDKNAPYLLDFLKEFLNFPNGKHDDIVDSTTQALDYIQREGGNQPRVTRI